MKYKVTLYLEANTHPHEVARCPRKWISETIRESLDDGEVYEYRIEQMGVVDYITEKIEENDDE